MRVLEVSSTLQTDEDEEESLSCVCQFCDDDLGKQAINFVVCVPIL